MKTKTVQQSTGNMNVEEVDKQGLSLVSRKEVKETPFEIISLNDKNEHFAVLGEYRLTEKYGDPRMAEKEVEKITWNRLIQVIMVINDKMNKK